MDDQLIVKVIDAKKTMLKDNDRDADLLREDLKKEKTFYLNIMSSPGAGKTTFLCSTIERLKKDYRIGVMEADIDSDVDAQTIAKTGAKAIQIHTGGMCHLDAQMSRQGLHEIGIEDLDIVFLENVGNLVCPAEFDTGAHACLVILSVPEGDDKPLKYPLVFEKADVVIVNKTDAMEVFDFDMDRFGEGLRKRNEKAPFFAVSAETGDGMDEWCRWFKEYVRDHIRGENDG